MTTRRDFLGRCAAALAVVAGLPRLLRAEPAAEGEVASLHPAGGCYMVLGEVRTAQACDRHGRRLFELTRWRSTDPSVVEIDEGGEMVARQIGSALIYNADCELPLNFRVQVIPDDCVGSWVKWEYIRRTFDERGEGFMYGRFSDNRYIGPCRIVRPDGSVEYMP